MEIIALASPLTLFVFVTILSGLRVINQYERGVVLTLGKYSGTRAPGLTWVMPVVQGLTKVDMRVRTIDIPQQEVITKDNVSVTINGVVYFKIVSAEDAILKIQNYTTAISQYAQTALRDVIGGIELDTLLAERAKISEEIEKIVDATAEAWGVDVSDIRIQDVQLDQNMRRVMAQQAEAERDRRATIIRAEGEFMAAEKLAQAAVIFANAPGGIQLRTLQTIEMAAAEPNKTVIFALPTDIMHRMPEFSAAMNS